MAMTNSILGLDIGTHSVKLVRAELKRKQVTVTHTETLRIPADISSTTDVILPWLKNLDFPKTPCVVGISGQQTMFQPLALTEEDPRSLAQAVQMEMARYHDMADEIMVHDFVTVEDSTEKRQLLLAMSRPAALDNVLDLPARAEFEVDDVIPSPAAMFHALRHIGNSGMKPCAYVNIGHSGTDIAIGNDAGLMFARGFAIGGSLFSDAVARVSGRSLRHAEDIKVAEVSITGGKKDMREAMTESANVWLSEIEACLSVYRTSYPEDEDLPTKLVLCGGGAEMKGLPQYSEAQLGMKVVEARLSATEPSVENPGLFAVALGYAIIGLGPSASRLSLLPGPAKEKLFLRRQAKHWIASAVCAALILGMSVIAGRRDIHREGQRLTQQREILKTCERLGDQIELIEKQTAKLLLMSAPVQRHARNGLFYQNLIELLARAKHSRDWVTMVCDADAYTEKDELLDELSEKYTIVQQDSGDKPTRHLRRPPPDTEKVVPQPHTSSPKVIVEGYTATRNLSTVKNLIAALNAAPMIEHADLLSDDKVVSDPKRDKTWANTSARRFVIVVEQKPLDNRSAASLIPAWRVQAPPRSSRPARTKTPGTTIIKVDAPKAKAPFTITATATSTHEGEEGEGDASALVDGKMSTRWSSEYVQPQAIILRLNKPSKLSKLRLHWESASARTYTVALSTDGKIWNTIHHGRNGALGPRLDEIDVGGAMASTIKIVLLNRANKNWGFSLYEIQVLPAK